MHNVTHHLRKMGVTKKDIEKSRRMMVQGIIKHFRLKKREFYKVLGLSLLLGTLNGIFCWLSPCFVDVNCAE